MPKRPSELTIAKRQIKELRYRVRELEWELKNGKHSTVRDNERLRKENILLQYGITMAHDFYMRIKQSAVAKDVLTCAGLKEPPK